LWGLLLRLLLTALDLAAVDRELLGVLRRADDERGDTGIGVVVPDLIKHAILRIVCNESSRFNA